MSKNKLSPLESLRQEKKQLLTQSNQLAGQMEADLQYAQQNWGGLIKNSVVSKMPPLVQNILNSNDGHANIASLSTWGVVAEEALDLIPYFVRGPKGIIVRFLVKQVQKIFLKG